MGKSEASKRAATFYFGLPPGRPRTDLKILFKLAYSNARDACAGLPPDYDKFEAACRELHPDQVQVINENRLTLRYQWREMVRRHVERSEEL